MRRIVIWLASTVTVMVLLFGYHTSTNRAATVGGTTAGTGQQSSTASGSSGGTPPDDQSTGQGTGSSTGSTSKSSTKRTVTGTTAATEWGPVQVEIVVKNKKITSVQVVQQPNGNPRDDQINSYALPILVSETISAQSAKIDMVSGATVTSDGYLQSLQSALDQAGL